MKQNSKTLNLGEALVPLLTLIFMAVYFIQTLDAPQGVLIWPIITAIAVVIFLIPILLKFVFSKSEKSISFNPSWLWKQGKPVGVISCATILYLVILPFLGFSLTNLAFMLAVFRGLGSKSWPKNLLVACLIAGFLHLALVVFMQLTLPRLTLGSIEI